MKIIFLGAPGAGKGTQAAAVSKEFGATYRAIHEIPASYKIKDIVNEYRATM